jgi:PEP-CTERM motif
VKTLASRPYLLVLALLALGSLPMATRADSITLNGAPIDSVSFQPNLDEFTVQMPALESMQYLVDVMLGTHIQNLTLDEYKTVAGVSTLFASYDFEEDIVDKYQFLGGDNSLTADITFLYRKYEFTAGSGSNSTVPEPSSALLLACGLIGLIGLSRKKLLN